MRRVSPTARERRGGQARGRRRQWRRAPPAPRRRPGATAPTDGPSPPDPRPPGATRSAPRSLRGACPRGARAPTRWSLARRRWSGPRAGSSPMARRTAMAWARRRTALTSNDVVAVIARSPRNPARSHGISRTSSRRSNSSGRFPDSWRSMSVGDVPSSDHTAASCWLMAARSAPSSKRTTSPLKPSLSSEGATSRSVSSSTTPPLASTGTSVIPLSMACPTTSSRQVSPGSAERDLVADRRPTASASSPHRVRSRPRQAAARPPPEGPAAR